MMSALYQINTRSWSIFFYSTSSLKQQFPLNWSAQLSVLYPSLFLYYIHDITVGLNSTIRLIAYDAIAYMAMQSIIDAH